MDDAPTDLEGKMFKVEEVTIDVEPLILQGLARLYEKMGCLCRGITHELLLKESCLYAPTVFWSIAYLNGVA